jgi:hypothetical protein
MARGNADLPILHAAELLTCRGPEEGVRGDAPHKVETIRDGAVAVRDGRIAGIGHSAEIEQRDG